MPKGSDLLVSALANEGVEWIFDVPGEENLDVVVSLRKSKIKLILTRHEQAASESYGAIGHRVKRTDDLVPTMEAAFKDSGVHLVTVPIDYAEDTRVLVEELRGRVPELA
jgi:thiamine pyrophosphate-dependent acetolactate synthase large subunit-like protein